MSAGNVGKIINLRHGQEPKPHVSFEYPFMVTCRLLNKVGNINSPISHIKPISFMNKFFKFSKNRYIVPEHKTKSLC